MELFSSNKFKEQSWIFSLSQIFAQFPHGSKLQTLKFHIKNQNTLGTNSPFFLFLAPTGALIVMMCYYTMYNFFNFHSVHWCNWCYKCHSKSLKQYQCNWCHNVQIGADWMSYFQCSNDPIFKSSIVQMFQCTNVFFFS